MEKYKNKISELKAWAKDDIVPSDLQWLCKASAEIIEQLQAELEKHRWIPVSERLPKESGMYQTVRKINQYPTTREYCDKSLMWLSQDEVTHWKPIILP